MRGYHKPIMIAGGLGNVRRKHVEKSEIPVGAHIVVLGGPAMLIGLGGGAASSMDSGASSADLDFAPCSAAIPRSSAARRKSSTAAARAGRSIPILLIHDVGAGGLSNAVPEAVAHTPGAARVIDLAPFRTTSPACRPWSCGATSRRSATCCIVDAGRLDDFAAIAKRERCPFAVIGEIDGTGVLVLEDRSTAPAGGHAAGSVVRQAAEDAARCARV